MHRDPDGAVAADVLRNDRFWQTELRVPGSVQQVVLPTRPTNHDVGARDISAATLIEAQIRYQAGAQHRIVVDDTRRLRVDFARQNGSEAREKNGTRAADQAMTQELSARSGPGVTGDLTSLLHALFEAMET